MDGEQPQPLFSGHFGLSFAAMRKLTHAEIAQKRVKIDEVETVERIPVAVVVDNVRSLYNVGSIFRTSDGAMIQRLVLTGYTPRPPRKEIEKTALGATKSVPWEYVRNPAEAIHLLKEQGFKICCLELTDRSRPYYGMQSSDFPLGLVIGNEITGISKDIVAASDFAVEIPMFGIKQSLNVAVAYGVAVFELSRLWRLNRSGPYPL
ncbi:MAG: rRNA methylase [Bacteroidetes bacterium]|nr:rRNA methylase [Bacteroidota bacterium]